ncbi:MAG: hypothetical protein RIQ79_2099 [Verrucomicrobiota bacterium]
MRRRKDGRPVQEFPDLATLLRDLDTAGIDHAILLGWYWEQSASCAAQNRFYAECVRRYPDRLSAYATFHPAAAQAAVEAELQRARAEGLCGVGEISPQSVGAALDTPAMEAALGLAADWRWPVNIHVTDPHGRAYPGKIETPFADMERMALSHPGVNFVLAHWAGAFDVRHLANVRVDTAAAPLIYGEAAWTMRGNTVRNDQVLFGSDYPLCLQAGLSAGEGLVSFAAEARRHGLAGA